MFSATALEAMLPHPHDLHLKSLGSLVSRKGVGTFPLQVNLPPEKSQGHLRAGCPDHRLLRSPSRGPSVGSMETAKTVLQFGKAGLLWGGTAVQATTASLPQFPRWILAALSHRRALWVGKRQSTLLFGGFNELSAFWKSGFPSPCGGSASLTHGAPPAL